MSPSAASTARIVGVDAARTLALLGMIVTHLLALNDRGGQGYLESGWFQLAAGRSSALFAVLAGVAIALISTPGRGSLHQQRLALTVRALLVALVGLFLGTLDSGLAIILVNYGLLFLLALPVLAWKVRRLALLALAWGLLTPAISQVLRPHLPENSYQVPGIASLADPWQVVSELLVTGYYPVLTWGTYLFAGMAIGRLNLGSGRYDTRLLVGGLIGSVFALGVSRWLTGLPAVQDALVASYDRWQPVQNWSDLQQVLPGGTYGTTPTGSWWWLGVWTPHSASIVDLAHTTGSAIALLGACLLLVRIGGSAMRRWWRILFGAGGMTLTLYTLHAVVLSMPDDWPGTHSLPTHLIGVLAIGALFAWRGWKGPLEAGVSQTSKALSLSQR